MGELYLRLGFTETCLLFYYQLKDDTPIKSSKSELINWLYSTSGFYDKTIEGDYFNFDTKKCLESDVYNKYMTTLLDIIKDCHLILNFHNFNQAVSVLKRGFEDTLKTITKSYDNSNAIHGHLTLLNNKRVLIINPMASLAKEQHENGNFNKMNPNIKIQDVQIIENPYTFFNNGPRNNIFETADDICKEISTKDFDIAIVSCGAISGLLGDYIRKMGKDAIVIGRGFHKMFGIKTKNTISDNEYLISIPEHLKPKDYMNIENGCYW